MAVSRFIVLEGIDGSGTTSQGHALVEALRRRGHRVLGTREPSDGPIGTLLRGALTAKSASIDDTSALALLFAADRLDHLAREIQPWLASGGVVVCDRYLLSSWVYQALDCDPAWVRSINRHAPWPDLTVVLEVPAEIAMKRVDARLARESAARERWDALAIQTRLAELYRGAVTDTALANVVAVDGRPEPAQVTAAILELCVQAGL